MVEDKTSKNTRSDGGNNMFGEAITLTYIMQPGEKLRYKTEVVSEQRVDSEGQEPQTASSTMEMVMLQEGKQLHPDGSIEVEVTIEDGAIHTGGQSEKLPTVGTKILIVMKKTGEIVRTNIEFPFSQPAFPQNQIKLNDTWTGDSQMDIPLYDDDGNQTGIKKADLKYHYTLAGVEQLKGYDVAVINVNCPDTQFDLQEEIKQSITATGVTYFAHKQGRLIKSQVSTKTEISAPGTVVGTKIRVIVELQDASGGASDIGGMSGMSGIGGDPNEQFIIS